MSAASYREEVVDSDKLNRWLTLGANLGVLAGILLRFQMQNVDPEFYEYLNEVARESGLPTIDISVNTD